MVNNSTSCGYEGAQSQSIAWLMISRICFWVDTVVGKSEHVQFTWKHKSWNKTASSLFIYSAREQSARWPANSRRPSIRDGINGIKESVNECMNACICMYEWMNESCIRPCVRLCTVSKTTCFELSKGWECFNETPVKTVSVYRWMQSMPGISLTEFLVKQMMASTLELFSLRGYSWTRLSVSREKCIVYNAARVLLTMRTARREKHETGARNPCSSCRKASEYIRAVEETTRPSLYMNAYIDTYCPSDGQTCHCDHDRDNLSIRYIWKPSTNLHWETEKPHRASNKNLKFMKKHENSARIPCSSCRKAEMLKELRAHHSKKGNKMVGFAFACSLKRDWVLSFNCLYLMLLK